MSSPPPALVTATPFSSLLTPAELTQLQTVADLMLQIYQTFARMRHIDPVHIQRGPHDLSHLSALFASLNLDPRIIHLYHILPYLDPRADGVSFIQGGHFADFRREADVRRARDYFAEDHDDDPGYVLHPWMTALTESGERGQLVVYDAQRDVVHFLGDDGVPSWDWNMKEGGLFEKWNEEKGAMVLYERPVDGREDVPLVEVVDIEAWRRARGWYGEEGEVEGEGEGENEEGKGEDENEEEEDNQQEEEEEEEDEEMDDDDDDDDDGESEQEIYWDEMEARPAARVLQDVIRWYHELLEIPGDFGNCGHRWTAEITRPLYRRHGWPGEDFDGDAFVVDQARSKDPEFLFREVGRLKSKMGRRLRDHENGAAQRQEKLAAAKTVNEEWVVRWEVWIVDRDTAWWKDRVKMAREWEAWGTAREDADGPPLKELAEVQKDLEYYERRLNGLKESLEAATDDPSSRDDIQERVRIAETKTTIARKAYEATCAEVQRVGPGKPLYSLYTTDIDVKMEYLTKTLRGWEDQVAEIQGWVAQLPDGTDEARALALRCAAAKEKKIEKYKGKLEQEAVRLRQRTEGKC